MYCDTYQPSHFLGLPVNTNYEMIESYLNGIHSVLKNACNQHSRTFVFQVVLKFPQAGGCFQMMLSHGLSNLSKRKFAPIKAVG